MLVPVMVVASSAKHYLPSFISDEAPLEKIVRFKIESEN